jgi:hypothetical protein
VNTMLIHNVVYTHERQSPTFNILPHISSSENKKRTYVFVITADHVAVGHVVAYAVPRFVGIRLPRWRNAIVGDDFQSLERRDELRCDGCDSLLLRANGLLLMLLLRRANSWPDRSS